ncbi:MAG: hypothetical protein ACREM3_07525 [Candidatus Rokuibacteriota bacterium]
MRKDTDPVKAAAQDAPHACVVAVNAAAVAFVDELLRLPSSNAAATVVTLLYGPDRRAPAEVLANVNGGIHIPLATLLASPSPLASLIRERLRVGTTWRAAGQALKGARAAARARYRDLASTFVASTSRSAPQAAASLVRYTYGTDGRHWLWADAAARVLHRMVALNRAVLGLLAGVARGEAGLDPALIDDSVNVRDFDLPDDVLDMMAAAMPPLAVPEWSRFAEALGAGGAPLAGDEATTRYQSLLAEILGLTTGPQPETRP